MHVERLSAQPSSFYFYCILLCCALFFFCFVLPSHIFIIYRKQPMDGLGQHQRLLYKIIASASDFSFAIFGICERTHGPHLFAWAQSQSHLDPNSPNPISRHRPMPMPRASLTAIYCQPLLTRTSSASSSVMYARVPGGLSADFCGTSQKPNLNMLKKIRC